MSRGLYSKDAVSKVIRKRVLDYHMYLIRLLVSDRWNGDDKSEGEFDRDAWDEFTHALWFTTYKHTKVMHQLKTDWKSIAEAWMLRREKLKTN